MSSKTDMISILTPSLNRKKFLPDAIESVRGQEDASYEHLILDGGSTDGTQDWVRSLNDSRIILDSRPDEGQSDALNRGLVMARGDIIGWINTDDRFLPGAFRAVREAFEQNPEIDLVFGNYRLIDTAGRPFRTMITFEWGVESLVLCGISGAVVGQPAAFWRKRLSDKLGGFEVDLHYTMDWDYWIRAREQGPFLHIDRSLADFRVHSDAKTADDLTHTEELLDLCARYIPRLAPDRQLAAWTTIDQRRAFQGQQREAVERVYQAVENWLNRREGRPSRLILYALGNNGRRLWSRMSKLASREGLELVLVDDCEEPGPLTPAGVVSSEQVNLRGPDTLVVVTPWEDRGICTRLTSKGLQEGRDFLRWSKVAKGQSGFVPARSEAVAAAAAASV